MWAKLIHHRWVVDWTAAKEEGRISNIPNHCPLDMHGGGVSGCERIGSLQILSCYCRGVWWWVLVEHFMYININTRLSERICCFESICTYALTCFKDFESLTKVSRQARSVSGRRSRDTSDFTSTFHIPHYEHKLYINATKHHEMPSSRLYTSSTRPYSNQYRPS